MVHDARNLLLSSIRTVFSFYDIKGYTLYSHEVTQENLQYKSILSQQIFIRPMKHDLEVLGLLHEVLFDFIIQLYSLCDTGDYWGTTTESHLRNDVHMSQSKRDASLNHRQKMDS